MITGRLPWLYAAASVLLLVLIVASDLRPLGFWHKFWIDYPMVTNVAASLLFVLLAYTVFSFWASRREAVQLRVVVLATYHAIAAVPLAQRRIMWTLANGDDSAWAEDATLTDDQRKQLREALARRGLPVVTVNSVRMEGKPSPDIGVRLTKLAQDGVWIELAYDAFRDLTREGRSVLAEWSPLLVATRAHSDLLIALSEQVEEMARIVSWLRGRRSSSLHGTHKYITAWRHAFTNATALEETLRKRLLRPNETYSYLERNLLETTELEVLKKSRGDGLTPLRVYRS